MLAAQQTFESVRREHVLSFFLYHEIPWYWSIYTAAELSQLMVRSPYLDNDFVKVIYRAPAGVLGGPEFQLGLMREVYPEVLRVMTDRGLAGSCPFGLSHLAGTYLRLADGFEKALTWDRVPHSLTHWSARVDAWLHRTYLDRLIRGRAYFRHYRAWFRDELSGYVKEMLLDGRTTGRPYWDKRFLEKIVRDHVAGKGNYLREIGKVLTVELIHRTLIEDAE